MSRNVRVGALVISVCLIAWLAVQWFSDRASFGWWTVIAFGVICVVALIKTVVSDFVSDRARQSEQK